MCVRGAGTGRWEAAGAGRARHLARESTAVPGVERAPTPVVSCRCGTWKPRPGPDACVPGKPTVRKAQVPGGNRMTRQADAGGRKAAGNRGTMAGPPLAVPDNWPEIGPGDRARKGADAGQVSPCRLQATERLD